MRTFLSRLVLLTSLVASAASFGQTYPDKPIKLIVPFAAGGGLDATARFVGIHLGKALRYIQKKVAMVSDIPADSFKDLFLKLHELIQSGCHIFFKGFKLGRNITFVIDQCLPALESFWNF